MIMPGMPMMMSVQEDAAFTMTAGTRFGYVGYFRTGSSYASVLGGGAGSINGVLLPDETLDALFTDADVPGYSVIAFSGNRVSQLSGLSGITINSASNGFESGAFYDSILNATTFDFAYQFSNSVTYTIALY